ncbi:MAG: hypothetical protein A2846_03255 [Candidatus Doudnabacteria bacterium RIFCSPHIGHO2_01_FULL_49_9]|uniref:Methyltransferase type 11 domain-containing protein n=1 Tax=Candidatus Doudnabacteria bacterium RIFCSPHIGHO2_01_FULL_49_9 TaxID=1817827 RepID=A0A1F5NYF5_9BACT|nr:MAG: hypothetical protein A2846_03255 [Candidatus Doudnabacteria bacterium RIFCSPHIGHO2_01_FULL_49_9]
MTKDHYSGVAGIYFWRILKKIGRIGELEKHQVLDFGCGSGRLKSLYPNVIGYDIDPRLSEVQDWRAVDFDTVVINEVFYEMTEPNIIGFLEELKRVKPQAAIVVGIGRRGLLNRVGAFLLKADAHDKYRIDPQKELEILSRYFRIEKKTAVFWLCDIFKLRFKS